MQQCLFVIPKLHNGGAERVIVDLANGMTTLGAKVGIATFSPGGDYADELCDAVSLYCLDRRSPHWLSSRGVTRCLAEIGKQYEFIVSGLHYQTDRYVDGCRTMMGHDASTHQFIAMVHNTLSQLPGYRSRPLRNLAFNRMYPKFDAVTTSSSGVRDDLLTNCKLDAQRVHVLYNPLNLARIREACQAPVDCAIQKPFFLAVGRLVKNKDYGTLLNAFRLFVDRHGSTHQLLILGRGRCEQALKDECRRLGLQEDVYFRGFAQNPWAYMRQATALVSSSIVEGFSLTIAEGLACGAPIIATDCPSGPAELLQGGRNGYLIMPRDARGIANAMSDVVRAPEEARKKSASATEFINSFDQLRISQRFMEILDTVRAEKLTPHRISV